MTGQESLLAAPDRQRLRALAVAARDAFPSHEWTSARHMSRASFAYVVSDNDALRSDPTGAFSDAITPDVLLALLDELDSLKNAAEKASVLFTEFTNETDESRIPTYDALYAAALRLSDAIRGVNS